MTKDEKIHTDILASLKVLNNNLDDVKGDVDLLKTKLILGNGEPSLLVRHALLEQKVNTSVSNKKLVLGLFLTFVLQTVSAIILYFFSRGGIKL